VPTDEPGEVDVVAEKAGEIAELPMPPLKSPAADWLDVHGGFVLLGGGLVLIGLACVFSEHSAVAPVFAVFGSVLLVLAAFYSRIEGPVQATSDGVAIAVRGVQRLARERDLSADEQVELVEQAVEGAERLEAPRRKPQDIDRVGGSSPFAAYNAVAVDAFTEWIVNERRILEGFAKWLAGAGGFDTARLDVRTEWGRYDLLAESAEEVMLVEAKARTRALNVATVHQIAGLPVPPDVGDRRVRRALVVPADERIRLGLLDVAKVVNVEIYEVWQDGGVERVL
jgi:hypothetical protein